MVGAKTATFLCLLAEEHVADEAEETDNANDDGGNEAVAILVGAGEGTTVALVVSVDDGHRVVGVKLGAPKYLVVDMFAIHHGSGDNTVV